MKHILSIITVFVLAGCSLPNTTVDTAAPPFISSGFQSLSIIDVGFIAASADTMIAISVSVKGTNVSSVTAVITASDGSSMSYVLLDSGVPPDQKANDGIYSGYVPLHLTKAAVGQYNIQIQASDNQGLVSNIIGLPVTVISSNNKPPIISALIAPDTVFVPTGSTPNYITVSVVASDADGLETIASVSTRVIKPDGTISIPYPLLDDGGKTPDPVFTGTTSGDATAGDGRFTLRIPVTFDAKRNEYRDFVFTAKDKSGAISNSLTKRIYIQ